MLEIEIQPREVYDEESQMFFKTAKPVVLKLEHSLISISKWEQKWHKPYINNPDKTRDELIDYIRCMTLNPIDNDDVYMIIDDDKIRQISEYINDPATATTVSAAKQEGLHVGKRPQQIITNEIVYQWMVALEIPFDPCEKWHLNRLLTFITVCSEKQKEAEGKNKIPSNKVNSQYAALNKARRAAKHTKG